jgi:hypothetical protein
MSASKECVPVSNTVPYVSKETDEEQFLVSFQKLQKKLFYQLAILTTFLSVYIPVNFLFLRLKDTNLTKEKRE